MICSLSCLSQRFKDRRKLRSIYVVLGWKMCALNLCCTQQSSWDKQYTANIDTCNLMSLNMLMLHFSIRLLHHYMSCWMKLVRGGLRRPWWLIKVGFIGFNRVMVVLWNDLFKGNKQPTLNALRSCRLLNELSTSWPKREHGVIFIWNEAKQAD